LPPGWTDRARFLRARNLPASAADEVQRAAHAVTVADLLMASATLDALHQELLRTLAAWHAGAPDQPGLQPERLRQQLESRPPVTAFRAMLDTLLRRGTVRQDGPWLRLSTHQIRLSASDERIWPQIRGLLGAERFRPPRTRDLAIALSMPETVMRGTLKRLQRVGSLLELAPDHFFLRETVAEMAAIAAAIGKNDPGEQLTAASFRDRLDNGRKVAIHILEYFDRVGLTVRTGDLRSVREDRLALFGPAEPNEEATP